MDRRIIGLILSLSTPTPALALDLYISPHGNDTWSGRLAEANADRTDGPFATLERARDEIRRVRTAAQDLTEPVTVHLRAGVYVRDNAFELTAQDRGMPRAPITYRAHKQERVRLTGGRRITDFAPLMDEAILERLDPAARANVLQADLRAAGIDDFGNLTPRGFGRAVQPAALELFFDDKPMTLARWPNEGWVRIADVPDGKDGGKFTYGGDRPERWRHADDVWLHGFWTWDWADSFEHVARIDTDRNEIATDPPHGVYGYKQGARYYALNLLEELDQPGEWYLDRTTGKLYFWPPSPIDKSEAWVSVLDDMIRLEDVSHVTFRGLLIDMVRGNAVTITGGADCRIAGCTIRNVGNVAVAVRDGTGHGVVGCDISRTGDGGITLTGGDRKTLTPGGHYALNNDIHDYSRWVITYRPAVSISGVGARVAHNLIHDAPHMGIALHGNEHVIEFNEVHHVCMDTDDAGAFYMGRDYSQRGNVVQHNYFHHVGDYTGRVGVQSIYLDDFTSGTTVYGNICYRAGRAVLIGGGRDNVVENNVFVDCTPAIHVDSRGLGWAKNFFDGSLTTLTDRLDAVNFREPPYGTRYPELLTLYDDDPALAKNNRLARNICVGGRWLDLLDHLTTDVVHAENNLVDQDPRFIDAEHQNFRLRADSPALNLGFKPIPFDKIGLRPDEFRTTRPAPP